MRTQNVAARPNAIPISTLIGSLALATLSRSSIDAKISEYVGARFYPRTDPAKVAILCSEPPRPHAHHRPLSLLVL